MPHTVQVNVAQLKLPNNQTYTAPDSVTLTDEQFAKLADTVFIDGNGPTLNCTALTTGSPITSIAVTYTSTTDSQGRVCVNGVPLSALAANTKAKLGGAGAAAPVSQLPGAPAPVPYSQTITISSIGSITATGATLTVSSFTPAQAFTTVNLASLTDLGVLGVSGDAVTTQGTAVSLTSSTNATSAVATTAPTNTTPYGYSTSAQALAIITLVNSLQTTVNQLVVDVAALNTNLSGAGKALV